MLELKKVAVTGGLAAGKTTVCQVFKELGAFTLNADEIVHHILSSNTRVAQQVIELFGSEVLFCGAIDRKKIAQQIALHPDKLRTLEHIIHPVVFQEIEQIYNQVKNESGYPLFVAEIPLLYEAEAEGFYDVVISVIADSKLCKERFLRTQSHGTQDFEQRVARQLNQEEKAARAQHIIYNNGTPQELKEQVRTLFFTLI